jgi:hypothetical protein
MKCIAAAQLVYRHSLSATLLNYWKTIKCPQRRDKRGVNKMANEHNEVMGFGDGQLTEIDKIRIKTKPQFDEVVRRALNDEQSTKIYVDFLKSHGINSNVK